MFTLIGFFRNPRSGARWCRAAIAIVLSLGLCALSAAQTSPASDGKPTPGIEAPAAAAPAADPAATEQTGESARIVLVLPLESAAFGRAAEAVRAGFIAAAAEASANYAVIGHGDDGVLPAFAKAKRAGARVIVGPLVRDDLKAVASAGLELPPTIVLNQLDEGAPLPESMYALSLSLDSEARQLARRARDDGAMSVAVIASDTPLQQRFAAAFNAEWILAGGGAPVMFRFDRSPEVLAQLRRDLIRTQFDAALLAIDGADAALAKSYVKSIPTYASSLVNDRQPREARRDLDELRFVDIPWLVDPDAASFAGLKRPEYTSAALERLYALGIDAFRIAQEFAEGPRRKLDLDGATGRLSLDANRQFVREGRLMVYRSGEIVPADSR
jgi:hypothetical protein